MHVFVVMIFSR